MIASLREQVPLLAITSAEFAVTVITAACTWALLVPSSNETTAKSATAEDAARFMRSSRFLADKDAPNACSNASAAPKVNGTAPLPRGSAAGPLNGGVSPGRCYVTY